MNKALPGRVVPGCRALPVVAVHSPLLYRPQEVQGVSSPALPEAMPSPGRATPGLGHHRQIHFTCSSSKGIADQIGRKWDPHIVA